MSEIFRKDYKALPIDVESLRLDFNLTEDVTTVVAVMRISFRGGGDDDGIPEEGLFLNGRDDIKLVSLRINGADVPTDKHTVTADGLRLHAGSVVGNAPFELISVVEIHPDKNTLLEGLYKSSGNYSTQCEAEGFRGITYFFDRPDVMTKYTTRIEADKALYPVLLSNGNLASSGDVDGKPGRHYAEWVDPFPKPSYLFALVAGQLLHKEDTFTTMSGRDVVLRIYVQERNIDKVDHAMASLKRSMKWDEEHFGREYDLSLFNIVAVDDFNMGAMENKSLNIFNSRLVLATSSQATDYDFSVIESVIGHEYFHNWTGNRVTCRDWFQLTLKEGLTVYREQEFACDMHSRPVERLDAVRRLRSSQYPEDRGPMAHPVRPDSYVKMDNFYTSTVYEKGAEVVRMYEMVLGKDGFRKGTDLYFQRHDGQAVTCDDFLKAMEDANGEDLSALRLWYGQAGTPQVTIRTSYDAAAATFTLDVTQTTPPTPGQSEKVPVLIPIRTALLGTDGKAIPLTLRGKGEVGEETVLRFTKASEQFVFENVKAKPVLSAMRAFSAPVRTTIEGQTSEDLAFLLQHDTDGFNRYEAGQVLARRVLLDLYKVAADGASDAMTQRLAAAGVPDALVQAFRALLVDDKIDGLFKSYALTLPTASELLADIPQCDPLVLHAVLTFVNFTIAKALRSELEAIVASAPAEEPEYVFSCSEVARRAIINKAYGYLSRLHDVAVEKQLLDRMRKAKNMTDEIAALNCLNYDCESRAVALKEFYDKWSSEPLVILKWFTVQATSDVPNNFAALQAIVDSDKFHITNPNSCYSMFIASAQSMVNFHAADGSGYKFLADAVLAIDKVNFQVAARVVGVFNSWKQFDEKRQEAMKAQLHRISEAAGVSENTMEIVRKALAQ
eukprot:PhM_4_TR17409/c0_g1_i1/m.69952/K01256/pepN; aminopeptidase N